MKTVVTGGAGFIGLHVVERLVQQGHDVTLLDNLARSGSEQNLARIQSRHPKVQWISCDVSKDLSMLQQTLWKADIVFHLAAQVAVTTSVTDPRRDFEINALGTVNVLEAMRRVAPNAQLIYSSTNKVYGDLEQIALSEDKTRYAFAKPSRGISEDQPLDLYSPYGCSKGAADQYVRDYHRIYGLNTVVFRQSCIYGDQQFGNEDQGWLAWFSIAALLGRTLTIYGNGKQVRDVLFAGDLVDAYMLAIAQGKKIAGQIFNMGGGPDNTLSLLELIALLDQHFKRPMTVDYKETRPGDQRIYISDIDKAKKLLGWSPKTTASAGLKDMLNWIQSEEAFFRQRFGTTAPASSKKA